MNDIHLKNHVVVHKREAIGFGMGDREVPSGPLDIAFNLLLNRFNGREYLQLHLQDFRAAQPAASTAATPQE